MIILGIDPGYAIVGWGVLEYKNNRFRVLDYGAILTKAGNVYVGVCIDTCSGLGMCAERSAMAHMLTCGESEIEKVVAVMPDGKVGSPCGACREFMMQLSKNSGGIEILLDLETERTVRLGELVPDWWGAARFEETSEELP